MGKAVGVRPWGQPLYDFLQLMPPILRVKKRLEGSTLVFSTSFGHTPHSVPQSRVHAIHISVLDRFDVMAPCNGFFK